MSHVREPAGPATGSPSHEPSLGTLVSQLSSQIPELIRAEMRLAQAEVTAKGKRAGVGIGMFSAAGLLALLGLGVLVAAFVLLLDLVMPAWAAALVVAGVLLAAAAVSGLAGKKKVAEAAPPVPERTIENLKKDVAAVKGDR